MERYIGTKLINAKPMTRQAYNDFRGWTLPSDENGADEGYLVEYINGGPANTSEYEGYVSWSPKEVFKKAYHPTHGMTFGEAIEAMKAGQKVARKGWNGKGMFIFMVRGRQDLVLAPDTPYNEMIEDDECDILSHIDMWTVGSNGRGAFLPGWLASQTDMLSKDWEIV